MLSLKYPIFEPLNTTRSDGGRIRNSEFFGRIYGKNQSEIQNNMTEVIWLKDFGAKKFKFNTKNGAAVAFTKVSDELNEAIKNDKSLLTFLDNPSGTFNYRKIAGTNRLSAHSYGIAIDINTNKSHYWRWHKNYENLIPAKIVEILGWAMGKI